MLLQSDVQEHVFTFKVILYICSTCQQSAAVAEGGTGVSTELRGV